MSLNERQVKAHPKRWMLPGSLHGVLRESLAHHEARSREDPPLMGLHDGLIDRQRQAEIVSGNNDFFQCTLRFDS